MQEADKVVAGQGTEGVEPREGVALVRVGVAVEDVDLGVEGEVRHDAQAVLDAAHEVQVGAGADERRHCADLELQTRK